MIVSLNRAVPVKPRPAWLLLRVEQPTHQNIFHHFIIDRTGTASS